MVGKPLMSNNCGVSLVGGFPKHFLFLRRYINRGRLSEIKFVLTLLNISRSIHPKKNEIIPVSLKTVIQSSKGTGYTIPSTFIKDFVTYFKLNQSRPIYRVSDFYLSLKSGPQGPSSNSALYSLSLYPQELLDIVFR
jgi:hypothetical protein